jgi:hypothetical protein
MRIFLPNKDLKEMLDWLACMLDIALQILGLT